MEIDSRGPREKKRHPVVGRSGIAKRKAKKSAIVFPSRKRKQLPGAKKTSA